jgi:hypothetical protein
MRSPMVKTLTPYGPLQSSSELDLTRARKSAGNVPSTGDVRDVRSSRTASDGTTFFLLLLFVLKRYCGRDTWCMLMEHKEHGAEFKIELEKRARIVDIGGKRCRYDLSSREKRHTHEIRYVGKQVVRILEAVRRAHRPATPAASARVIHRVLAHQPRVFKTSSLTDRTFLLHPS